jgi:hypothetical protein
MIGGFRNIIGLGISGRTKALNDFIKNNKLDFVGVQETKKNELSETTLNPFLWSYDLEILAR